MRKIPVFLLFLALFLINFSVLVQNDDFIPPLAIDYAPKKSIIQLIRWIFILKMEWKLLAK